jgi:hypothetical protein
MKLTDITNNLGLTNIKQEPQEKTPHVQTEQTKNEPRVVYLTWQALSRPQKKPMHQKTLKTLIIIGAIIGLLLAAMQQFFLIIVILSLIFISYMLSQVPGESIKYELTNEGINYADVFYSWADLRHFFFFTGSELDVIAVDIKDGIPARIYLTLPEGKRDEVKRILGDHIMFLEEEPKSFMDKAYESVLSRINLE